MESWINWVTYFAQRTLSPMYWSTDIIVAMAFSFVLGRFDQSMADSGKEMPNAVALSIFIAIGSYVLAILPLFICRNRTRVLPSWFWIGVVGSMVYSFNRMIVYFTIVNLDTPASDPSVERAWHLIMRQIDEFVVSSLLLTVILVPLLFCFRFARSLIDDISISPK